MLIRTDQLKIEVIFDETSPLNTITLNVITVVRDYKGNYQSLLSVSETDLKACALLVLT